MSRLLAHQQATYNYVVHRLKTDDIKKFETEHELFLFVEIVKYPFLNRTKVNTDILLYDGESNYGPIVKELVKKGILVSNQTGYTVNV